MQTAKIPIFVSAQPDSPYFHWQLEIYLYQFATHGIIDRCYALLGYRGEKPSDEGLALAKKYPHVLFYKDERNISVPYYYNPTIRPHLLKTFFTDYPDLGTCVFYHDSDILLVQMPKFELLINDDICYLSDTISYIGYKYIDGCQKRYIEKYPSIGQDEVLTGMCNIVGVSVDVVKANELNSGGAQYLLKNTDAAFWTEAEGICQELYSYTKSFHDKYPIDRGIQMWTADMWVVLWLLWIRGVQTKIHTTLDFSWATGSVADYHRKPIFHLAGVVKEKKEHAGMFHKGSYVGKNLFKEYLRDPSIFDHVDRNNATYEYLKIMKEIASGTVLEPTKSRFLLDSAGNAWSSVYQKDETRKIFNRPVWRSADNNYLIFHNNVSWVVTHKRWESELKERSGGFASSNGDEPYEGEWNIPSCIKILQ